MRPNTECWYAVELRRGDGRAAGLTSEHDGQIYYFCGKGCKLDFEENAAKYLDPGYKPSMEM